MELQLALYVCVVLTGLGIILKRLVIKVDEELATAQMATEAFDGPDDTAGLEANGSFVVVGSVVDAENMAGGAAR